MFCSRKQVLVTDKHQKGFTLQTFNRRKKIEMVLELKTIKYKDKVVFEKMVMTNDFKRVPKFFQENEACFLFLTKGAFQFRTPTNVLTFNEGEAMLSKCGNYFFEQLATNPNPQSNTISAVAAYFYPVIVKHFFQTDLSIKILRSNFDTTKVSVEPLLKSFIDSINYLLDNPQLADEDLILNKLKELLLLLSKTEQSKSINEFVASLFVPREYNFNDIIQKNIFSNLSIDNFAKLTNSSKASFKRKFAELYNESPAKYISNKKLEKATQLLQIKSKPIADIAYECGFETVSNFNRAFKLQYGKTPTVFRFDLI